MSATWGDETGAEAEDQEQAEKGSQQVESDRGLHKQEQDQPGFSLWGVASAFADTVRKNTADVTTGLKETNWRAELEAFGKGVREEEHQLRKETAKQVEVVKERLPKQATAQLDLKAKELAAHLQKMGVGLGGLGKTLATRTSDLFDQVRDTVVEELSAGDKAKGRLQRQGSRPSSKGKYSRLEADINSMQRDSATYCDEPADTADYQAWRAKFDLAVYKPAVEGLITENAFMAELQARIVPVIVEYDAFWTRYFYRLHLLEARHAQRLKVAQRASKPQQEEELAWDDAEEQPQQKPAQASDPPSNATPTPQAAAASSSEAASKAQATADPAAESAEAAAPEAELQAVPEAQTQAVTCEDHASAKSGDDHTAASTVGDDSSAETLTGSESGSGNEHWTVVKSPSKQAASAHADAAKTQERSQASPQHAASSTSTPAAVAAQTAQRDSDTDSEIDELDDVSNDGEVNANAGPGSEGDEDWSNWE